MSRPSENVKLLLENIGREIYAELSGTVPDWRDPEIRAYTENDLVPYMIFTILGPMDEDVRRADQGYSAQVQALALVNVTFEISESDAHYLAVFDARCAVVAAIQRVLRDAPASLQPEWRGEEEAQLSGVTLSQNKIVIGWDQPA